MCLVKKDNKLFVAKLKKKKEVNCYKIYYPDRALKTLECQHRGNFIVEKPGWVVSNRETKKFNRMERTIVNKGIHVFLNKKGAEEHLGTGVIIPVRCYYKDLVAVGILGNSTESAVFMKVRITKKAFDKAVE